MLVYPEKKSQEWIEAKRNYFINRLPNRESQALDDKIIYELLHFAGYDNYIKQAMRDTKGLTIDYVKKASMLLFQLTKGEKIYPVDMMISYAESGLFYANQDGSKQSIPIQKMIDFFKLSNAEIYIILLASVIVQDERILSTLYLNCIEVLFKRNDPDLKNFLTDLHYNYLVGYRGNYNHSFEKSAINLPAIQTFILTEMQSSYRHKIHECAILESFSMEVYQTRSVDDFLNFVFQKLSSNKTEPIIKELIAGYICSDPNVYNEVVLRRKGSGMIYPSRQFFHNAKIAFFSQNPNAQIALIEQIRSRKENISIMVYR